MVKSYSTVVAPFSPKIRYCIKSQEAVALGGGGGGGSNYKVFNSLDMFYFSLKISLIGETIIWQLQ